MLTKNNWQLTEMCLNKLMSAIRKKARKSIKPETCFICGNSSKFINSHTIPRFVLKNIAKNGKINTTNSILQLPTVDVETGINDTCNFYMICANCDSSVFSEYECPDNYEKEPTQRMLAQIDMKTGINEIEKILTHKACYEIINTTSLDEIKKELSAKGCYEVFKLKNNEDHNNAKIKALSFNLNDSIRDFNYAKNYLDNEANCNYNLGYYKKLPYRVPIAVQDKFCLITDFNQQTINNTFDYSESNELEYINICIFPFDEYSIIILFNKKNSEKYVKFYQNLNHMNLSNQLKVISYITFNYSQKIFYYKNLDNLDEKNLKIIKNSLEQCRLNEQSKNNLHNYKSFPNLLSKDFKVNITL